MLDIIIPYYNDSDKILRTLYSLGSLEEPSNIIIVDDCSNKEIEKEKIQSLFPFLNFTFYRLEKNQGPGLVRQYGIDNSYNDFIMFIDSGDQLLNTVNLNKYIAILKDNPNINIIACSHMMEERFYNSSFVPNTHNRMHGKIYRRKFLENYNIKFNPKNSYINEDIGFNMLCREIIDNREPGSLLSMEEPLIMWRLDENSLTHKNKNESFYNEQNMALAKSAEYVITNLKKLNISFLDYQYKILCDLYIFFNITVNSRPEFLNNSFNGAKYFYNLYFKNYNIDLKLLNKHFQKNMSFIYAQEDHPFNENFPVITILDFLKMLEEKIEYTK